MENKEEWKNVSELGTIEYGGKLVDMSCYTNYEISNYGKVKSLNFKRSGKEHILEGIPTNKGYLRVSLSYKGKEKLFTIHRLVALMFIPNPNNLPQINHISEDKIDNRVKNLEWCTSEYNINHGTHTERMMETRKTNLKWKKRIILNNKKQSKQVYQYTKDLELVRIWESTNECGRNGFEQSNISSCCLGKLKTHQGFIWSYHPLRKTAVRMGYFGSLSINGYKLKKVG